MNLLLGVIDLTDITGELTATGTAVVTALGVAAVAGLGVMAVRWGGKACVSFFKSLGK